jgi:hypothetical protein
MAFRWSASETTAGDTQSPQDRPRKDGRA